MTRAPLRRGLRPRVLRAAFRLTSAEATGLRSMLRELHGLAKTEGKKVANGLSCIACRRRKVE